MKNKNTAVLIWEKIRESILKNNWVVLFIVVDSNGSSPGKPGFKMMVSESGFCYGSVGGGQVEYELQQSAHEYRHAVHSCPFLIEKTHQAEDKSSDGGICGGVQKIAAISLEKKDLKIIEKIINACNSGKGYLKIDNKGFDFIVNTKWPRNIIFKSGADNSWVYKENLPLIRSMYIVGGGHVGRALARQMDMLGFRVLVLDYRPEIDTPEYAYGEIVIVDYDHISQHIPEDDNHFVVIATSGHAFDHLVLRKLIDKKYAYLGMLGSRTKVDHIFDKLRTSGISETLIEQVRAPVGIPIHSRNPAEIAVSIAAEIIELINS